MTIGHIKSFQKVWILLATLFEQLLLINFDLIHSKNLLSFLIPIKALTHIF